MEKIIFGTEIPDLTGDTVATMTAGQIGLLLYSPNEAETPTLRGIEVTYEELHAAKGIQFIKKTADGATSNTDASLIIPTKQVFDRNYQAYVAPVAGVFKLGDNAAAETALTIPSTGEGNIRLTDLTTTYQIDNFPANISVTKKANETVLAYLNRVVSAINNDQQAKLLVVAALQTASGRYQIQLTTVSANIKLGVATDGIFEPYNAITVTPRVVGKGTYSQMVQIEKDLTVFAGNGNYMENGDLYYKEPLKAIPGTNYNVLSQSWTATTRPTHSTSMVVANPNLLIAVPAGSTSLATLFNKFVTPTVTP